MEVIQLENQEAQLQVLRDKSELPQTKSQEILDKFQEFLKLSSGWERQIIGMKVTDVSQVDLIEKNQKLLKIMVTSRTTAKKLHDELKKSSLNEGRFIDGLFNVYLGVTAPLEEEVKANAKFIEVTEQNKRDAIRKERVEALRPYTDQAEIMPVVDMTEEQFAKMLGGFKAGHEAQKVADELAAKKKKDDEEKLTKENLLLRRLNSRLTVLSNMGAKIMGDPNYPDRGRFVSIWLLETNDSVEETTANLMEMDEEQFKEVVSGFNMAKEHNDKIKQRDIDAHTKLQEKADKDAKSAKDETNAKRRAARAPDKTKAHVILSSLDEFQVKLPAMTSDLGQEIVDDTRAMIDKMKLHISKKINKFED